MPPRLWDRPGLTSWLRDDGTCGLLLAWPIRYSLSVDAVTDIASAGRTSYMIGP